MPELPEVEVTRRGLEPNVVGQIITQVKIHRANLRWPIPQGLAKILKGQNLISLSRRGKYLLWQFPNGTLLTHLGMSGKLRIVDPKAPLQAHDHLEWIFANNICVRFNDPRRFGCVLWTTDPVEQHPLLQKLGPEPLTPEFSVEYLLAQAKKRQVAVKPFLMNNHIVVGVGNIYATEALFAAGINPSLPAKLLTAAQIQRLVPAIKKILTKAITKGGTTLRDFLSSSGEPGYFRLHLYAYGREGKPCRKCKTTLVSIRQGQRTTTYCPSCQKIAKLKK
jgi:formamidopyrimidine-DNA glycosylase